MNLTVQLMNEDLNIKAVEDLIEDSPCCYYYDEVDNCGYAIFKSKLEYELFCKRLIDIKTSLNLIKICNNISD